MIRKKLQEVLDNHAIVRYNESIRVAVQDRLSASEGMLLSIIDTIKWRNIYESRNQ